MTKETEAQNIENELTFSPEYEKIKKKEQEEPMHGQFYRELKRPSVDNGKSLAWLRSSGIKGETESLIVAVQDQALKMLYHQRNIIKQQTDRNAGCGIRQKNT